MGTLPYLNKTPVLGQGVYIAETALVIGDVELGADASVWPMSVVRGDVHAIKIGAGTNIQDACVLHVTHDGEYTPGGHALSVGENVTIGHRVVLHGCRVGHHCLIGIGAIVMDGAVIEDEVILGAGSLVPPGRTLESEFLYVGSPVRKVRPLTEREKSFLRYSAHHYRMLKDAYLDAQFRSRP
jgi:carbonic anhydrase/acetyltransferase-like protein (isoleucine patch superfamily)